MHFIARFTCASGYVLFAALVVMTTAAYLEETDMDVDASAQNPVEQPPTPVEMPVKIQHMQKRQSFSVTQDLDALAEMLREATMRRRLKNAIAFFNALKKRDLESTYGSQALQQLMKGNDNRK